MITDAMPEGSVIVADPGMSAVYPAAFWKIPRAGRYFATNYAMGALGWGLGAAIGATFAVDPGTPVLNFIGDGSFGFTSGELETLSRLGRNLKVILFNNGSFGWIRATNFFSFGMPHFATDLGRVDYMALAKSYGLAAFRASSEEELASSLAGLFDREGPALLELVVPPEDECIPPVPEWGALSREKGLACHYWES
jgi:acetolactate synthase-1/2/3 large subunit